jgi:hypothetical protein
MNTPNAVVAVGAPRADKSGEFGPEKNSQAVHGLKMTDVATTIKTTTTLLSAAKLHVNTNCAFS